MKTDRITRVNEIIHRELAQQLYRVIRDPGFDPAAVMINRVETAVNLRTARVYVSIRATEAEQSRLLSVLRRHRADFQKALSSNVVLRYTPQLHFVLDHSIERGDSILHLLDEMQAAGQIPTDSPPPEDDPAS